MPPSELKRSALAPVIEWLYAATRHQRRLGMKQALVWLALRTEGGAMYSATARTLLAEYHALRIGAFSYGPCFTPGVFPPEVEIGRFTSIAEGVRVVNENHPTAARSTHPFFYTEGSHRHATTIGSDVWIGFNALILPGCRRVGHGAIIGAGSVLTKDVPDYAIVAGVPAKVIGYRFAEPERQALLQSQWWELPLDEARAWINRPLLPTAAS